MKTHLAVFALSAILVASIGMAHAFGQMQDSIVVTTDKTAYAEGDVIVVTGQVKDLYSGTPVSVIVKAPNGNNIVSIAQVTVGADKKFSTEITAGGMMKAEGEYTVNVQYGENRSASTSFQFGGIPDDIVVDDDKDKTDPRVTATTVSFEGTSDLIEYEITGGKLLNIVPNVEENSLIIYIDATEDGSLTLTIPKSILKAIGEDGEDTDFFVLVDLEQADFDETISPTGRVLTIAFPAGAEEIEIIGTWVIPEFGAIVAMILAVAIISIIAISARSRLSIMPRY